MEMEKRIEPDRLPGAYQYTLESEIKCSCGKSFIGKMCGFFSHGNFYFYCPDCSKGVKCELKRLKKNLNSKSSFTKISY